MAIFSARGGPREVPNPAVQGMKARITCVVRLCAEARHKCLRPALSRRCRQDAPFLQDTDQAQRRTLGLRPTESMPPGSKPPDLRRFPRHRHLAVPHRRAGRETFGSVDDGVGVDAIVTIQVIDRPGLAEVLDPERLERWPRTLPARPVPSDRSSITVAIPRSAARVASGFSMIRSRYSTPRWSRPPAFAPRSTRGAAGRRGDRQKPESRQASRLRVRPPRSPRRAMVPVWRPRLRWVPACATNMRLRDTDLRIRFVVVRWAGRGYGSTSLQISEPPRRLHAACA